MAASISGLASSSVSPMNYAVENQSATSISFAERLQAMTSLAGVNPTAPVQYANATVKTEAAKTQENINMSAAYNDIASGFSGAATAYDRNSMASSYAMVGTGFDSFA